MMPMWRIFKDAARLWYDRDGDRMAAVVSYYAVFALTPLVLALMTLVGLLFGEEVVGEVLLSWGQFLGHDILTLLQTAVLNLRAVSGEIGVPVVIGSLFFLGVTIMGLNEYAQGLHELWGVPHRGFRGWVRKNVSSVLFIVFLAVFVALFVGITEKLNVIGMPFLVGFFTTFILLTTLFAVSYRLLPYYKLPTTSVILGGGVSAALFMLSKFLVAVYVSATPFPDTYGTAGLVVALLIWVYVAAAVLYFGAAVAYVHARHRGEE